MSQTQTQTQTIQLVSDYHRVDYAQPHWARKKKILEKYPELKDLYAPDPMSAVYATVLAASVFFMAYLLQNQPFWVIFLSAYVVGATIDHSLWVLIHDFTHNAAFKDRNLNMIFLLVANMPHIFPSGVSFRYYHLLHHSFLNETYGDPDVPGPTEARIFGHSAVGKMAWLALFPFLQTLRTLRYSSGAFSMWMVANWVANLSLAACVLHFIGLNGFLFMLISSVFSIGFHPVGARWIAEHWAVKPPQETYSYYGPLNRVAFNIGYHNEHHDLPEVPWSKLPEVKKRAAEFYDSLYWHDSYLKVLAQFFFSPEFTLTSRVVRQPRKYD